MKVERAFCFLCWSTRKCPQKRFGNIQKAVPQRLRFQLQVTLLDGFSSFISGSFSFLHYFCYDLEQLLDIWCFNDIKTAVWNLCLPLLAEKVIREAFSMCL